MTEEIEAAVPQDTDFEATVKLAEADPVAAEAMRRRDEELAERGGATLSHMDGHLTALSGRETPMTLRPASAYADDEPPLDPPTQEDLDARRKWADRHIAVVTIPIAVSPSPQPAQPDRFCDACHDQQQGFGKCPDHTPPPSPQPAPYHNPLAALRRERKVKSGKAAKLLGISRQRLHVVEHATKPLRCMDRLLATATTMWPVVDETTEKATP